MDSWPGIPGICYDKAEGARRPEPRETDQPMPILFASLIVLVAAAGEPPLEHLGRFDARAIPEASGIVKSRRFPGIFWVHNDSGNAPLLFAVRSDGKIVRRFRLAIPNLDWEDIAIDDRGHLYLGDIGNNTGLLRTRIIYRIDEPDPSSPEVPADRPLAAASAVSYALPRSNRFDAEGLFYDRKTATLVTKYLDGREAELFAVPMDAPSPPTSRPVPVAIRSMDRLPDFTEPATGASLSEDGTRLAVCSYAVTRVYRRGESPPWQLVAEVRYDSLPIEGITWDGRDLILAAEEGRGLYRLTEATWRTAAARREPAPRKSSPSLESRKRNDGRIE